ncbi:MAG: glycosyltransferase family 9 protein [Gemmatimonadales bacterium]
MSSLVVQTSFLGDIVLSTGLIAELAKRGPVDVLTTPLGSAILVNSPHIRNLLVYDRRGADRGVAGFARTANRIRRAGMNGGSKGPHETAYMAQGSLRSAALVAAAGIKNRIGFDTSDGRRLYTGIVEYGTGRHHAERLWWLSMSPCADPPSREQIAPRLFPSPEDERAAEAVLSEQLASVHRPFVALAPGAAWGTKRWPFYDELAVKIGERANVVIVGGKEDGPAGDRIVAQLPQGLAANAAGRLSLLGSAALLGRAAALVTNDSAPQHLASGMNTPTITIFGPTSPEFGFGPLAEKSIMVENRTLACHPCDHHGPSECPLGHWRCMRELTSSDVFDLLVKNTLLSEPQ